MTSVRAFLCTILLGSSFALQAQTSAAIADVPADKANPAAMVSFTLPTHGSMLNAIVYVAPGAGPHPVAVLLHGFPGNERNLDLAQAMRRAGWDVLYFNYRGAWGSPGAFSFAHCLEDSEAAVAYMRDPSNVARLRADPRRIVVVGHSMGGWMAAATAAYDPGILAAVLISAADMPVRGAAAAKMPDRAAAIALLGKNLAREGIDPLAGTSATALARELVEHGAGWQFSTLTAGLATRPVLLVSSDDGLAPGAKQFAAELRARGDTRVEEVHFATDHGYSDDRIGMEQAVLRFLGSLPPAAATPDVSAGN